MTMDDVALADRLSARRARVAIVLAIFFVISMFTSLGTDFPASRPQTVKLVALMFWAAGLLCLLAVGGGLLRNASVRALMNDETTKANRREGINLGFWAMIFTAFVLFGVSLFEFVSVREALRLMLTAGVACAVLRFGILEQRSMRG